MAIVSNSGWFDTVAEDRDYDASVMNNRFKTLTSDGVVTYEGDLGTYCQVTALGTTSNVAVNTGYFNIQGGFINITTAGDLSVDLTNTSDRIDRVVIEFDNSVSVRTITPKILEGTPATIPVAPTLTQTDTLYQISLAQIYISTTASVIYNSDITDERTKSSIYINDIVDNLTSTESTTALSANQGRALDVKKINIADIEDSLTSTSTTVPLSANQGKELSEDVIANASAILTKANTASPILTGAPETPTPTTDAGIANKGYVDEAVIVYDLIIKTQTEFETMIASSTWLDAESVALVGQFTLSTTDNSGVKIPSTVVQIHGYNGAKITITNFAYNYVTALGGLWYSVKPTIKDYSIRDLEVDCTGTTTAYGFNNCNYITSCTGTATGTTYSYGFGGCKHITSCTGTATGTTSGRGFWSCKHITSCIGTGTGATGYGFFGIDYATNCSDGGSTTNMWSGTNANIDTETCRKTPVTADNTTLNA